MYNEKHICPWGMVNSQKGLLGNPKIKMAYNTLPINVKEQFKGLTKETFNKDDINLSVEDEGNIGFEEFSYMYCTMCAGKSSNVSWLNTKAFCQLMLQLKIYWQTGTE